MKTIFVGKNCIEVDKIDSTNSFLSALASSDFTPTSSSPALELRSQPSPEARLLKEKGGAAVFEGTVVVAKHQEQGRGQRGTSWESEPGKNLILSILLKPSFLRPEEQFQLNKVVSLGVAECIHPLLHLPQRGRKTAEGFGSLPFGQPKVASAAHGEWGGSVSIKWPNDIYIGSHKIAGILIENSVSGNKLQQSIVGIGLNVNQEKFSADLPNPTSLKLISGKEFDLKNCLEELCSCIEKRYLELRAGQVTKIDADYLKNLYHFGELSNYNYKGDALKAKITGVTKVGMLILETETGKILECDLKEVKFC